MRKTPKIIFHCVVIAMIAATCTLFFIQKKIITKVPNNLWTQKASAPSSNLSRQHSPSVSKSPAKKIAEMGERVTTEGFSYAVFDAQKSKDREMLSMPEEYPDVTLNKEGTITNGYSYCILGITMQNTENTKEEMYLNSSDLVFKDKTGKELFYGEPELLDINANKQNRKDYFEYTFLPRETLNFHLGFFVPDRVFQHGDGILIINNVGIINPDGTYGEDVRFVKISFKG